ncbi:MAG: V-type ATP synthase subunit F [Ruminiclostridium sp.]
MKFFLISDNIDTQMGMRLAGIEGVVVHRRDEVEKALDSAMSDKDVAIVLMTEKLINLCRDKVYDLKLHCPKPLIVEIPDRHGTSQISDTISSYVSEAIGIKL